MSESSTEELLKRDIFGRIVCRTDGEGLRSVSRELRDGRWWARPLARHLLRRESRALAHLHGTAGIPALLALDRDSLQRSWIAGSPMHRAKPRDPRYFREALTLLRRLHARNLVHNDLAKETNWLVTDTGAPALVDFQLSRIDPRRGRVFRMLAHDDLRHLLKHKRTYLAEHLTRRERRILASPSPLSKLWRASGKRLYVFITRSCSAGRIARVPVTGDLVVILTRAA